ncbi:MAG: ATP-binding protein [Halobacteriovoraceae bacterium]|nr:ATP-binding protein [Halobacteriovoraceae bacterium]
MSNRLKFGTHSASFFKKLVLFQLCILILGLISTYLVSSFFYKDSFHKQTEEVIFSGIHLYEKFLYEKNLPPQNWCDLKLVETQTPRITVIDIDGKVLCDNRANKSLMDNHINRPEIIQALKLGKGKSTRFSNTIKLDMVYGAIKTIFNQKVTILRFALPMGNLASTIYNIQRSIFLILVPLFVFIMILNIWFSFKEESMIRGENEKLKEDLTANISHEVRTPLTALKGHIQVIQAQKENFPETLHSFIDRMAFTIDRLTQLFKDLLDLSSLENNQELFYEIASPEETTKRIISNLNQIYQAKRIKIQTKFLVDSFEVDTKILEQIITNLLDNAYKYTPSEGTIKIEWTTVDNKVHLSIEDTGIGISQKDISRIFERFYRVDASRSRELGGTGLGLAIVKHAVSQLNGEITVSSTLDLGTTFNVFFPSRQNA